MDISVSGKGAGSEGFGLALVLAMEVPNLYSAPLPSKMTIATFTGSSPEKQAHTSRWIRSGEIEGTVQALLLGVGGSIWQKSPWPILLVGGMVAWKVWSYEDALRRGAREGLHLDIAGQGG